MFRSSKLLTASKSGGVGFIPPGRKGRESLLVVDTDGAIGSCGGVLSAWCQGIQGGER